MVLPSCPGSRHDDLPEYKMNKLIRMATLQTYQFTRVRDDPANQAVQNTERQGPGSYRLTNLVPAPAMAMATAYQQSVIPPPAAGYGWSATAVDVDSVLRNHDRETRIFRGVALNKKP